MVRRRARGTGSHSRVVDATEAATCLQMLAVLLQAGAHPVEAWHHLATTGDPRAEAIAQRLRDGDGVVEALEAEGGAWRDVAAAWEVATTVGAPLADALRSVAETLRDAAAGADDVRIALAEPAGTARLLLWMPVAGLLLGLVLGFDTLGAVTRNPIGAVCLALGMALVLAARMWTRRLLARAVPPTRHSGSAGRTGRGRALRRGVRRAGEATRERVVGRDRRRRTGADRPRSVAERGRTRGGVAAGRCGARASRGSGARTDACRAPVDAPAAPARGLHAARLPPARRGPAAVERSRLDAAADLTTAPDRTSPNRDPPHRDSPHRDSPNHEDRAHPRPQRRRRHP